MMDIIVYIVGGFVAGIATGMIGLSAATIIAPLFVTALGMEPYMAIGIALASDFTASVLSTYRYYQHKNIQIKSATIMAITVVIFTIGASYFSRQTNSVNLGIAINVLVLFLGIRFLVYPVKERGNLIIFKLTKSKLVSSIFWGAIIGITSGYFGAGGGLSILAVLTLILGYELKTAVGTSVFIMVFTAFVGSASHIVISGTLWMPLAITATAAMFGANLSSKYANKINNRFLNIIIGSLLTVFGAVLIIIYLLSL